MRRASLLVVSVSVLVESPSSLLSEYMHASKSTRRRARLHDPTRQRDLTRARRTLLLSFLYSSSCIFCRRAEELEVFCGLAIRTRNRRKTRGADSDRIKGALSLIKSRCSKCAKSRLNAKEKASIHFLLLPPALYRRGALHSTASCCLQAINGVLYFVIR